MRETAGKMPVRAMLMAGVIAVLLAFATCIATSTAFAESGDPITDTWGTCTWELDADGTLTIAPTNGTSGTLGSSTDDSEVPWLAHAESIKQVVFQPGVKLAPTNEFLFYGCSNLTSMSATSVDASNLEDAWGMFCGCSALTSLDLSGWDVSSLEDMGMMFRDCDELQSINLTGWNPSSAKNMSGLFYWDSNLQSLDLSGWDTSNVTDMSSMFDACNKLATLDITDWDTSNVTDMSGMFSNCWLLDPPIYELSVENVTNMSSMFYGCKSLTRFNGDFWFANSLKDMSFMFSGCTSLSIVEIYSWDVSHVEQMDHLFDGCTSLTSLVLSGWDTSLVWIMTGMFEGCSNLETIYVDTNWTTAQLDTRYNQDMFDGCASLVGGNGTKYDSSKISYEYARIDSKATPGYFTISDYDKVDISKAALTLSATSYTWNGKAKKPSVTVKLNGTTIPTSAYTVAYKNNTNPGTATVTVTGQGGYKGSVSKTFTIAKAANPIVVTPKKVTVKYAKVKKKAQTIAAKSAFAVSKNQGAVTYAKASGNKKITVAKNGKITVKKKLKKGTYKVKVKVTAAGNAYYKQGVKNVTLTVRVK